MENCNLLMTFLSVIFGGIITWVCSWFYYRKAGKDLVEESHELRRLINALIIMEQNEKGQIIPKLDSEHKVVTILGMIKGESQLKFSSCASLSKKKI